jgi:hypothetical protein
MEHFVTLLDHRFLPQCLALHRSMERHVPDFALWVLCVNDRAAEALDRLQLKGIRLLALSGLETDELRRVKTVRSGAEYCWTVTPFAPRYVFDADDTVARVTYLDADLAFLADPEPVFAELKASGKSILITPHGYAPEHDQSRTAGKYCVQFVVFERSGEPVRKWWQDRCLEWCYARHEDGKFGDQKYLESWPGLFGELVHVARSPGMFLAPWNSARFPLSEGTTWHFHGLRVGLDSRGAVRVWTGSYPLPAVVIRDVYRPYADDIQAAVDKLRAAGIDVEAQRIPNIFGRCALVVRALLREFWRIRAGRVLRS